MKSILQQILIILFAIAFLYGYHLVLNWLASIFSWEGTAIGLSLIAFMSGIFITGIGKVNKEYDEVYAENRIEALLAKQDADRKLIKELQDELSYQKSIISLGEVK